MTFKSNFLYSRNKLDEMLFEIKNTISTLEAALRMSDKISDEIFDIKMEDVYRNKVDENIIKEVYDGLYRSFWEAQTATRTAVNEFKRIYDAIEDLYDRANKISREEVDEKISIIISSKEKVKTLAHKARMRDLDIKTTLRSSKEYYANSKISFEKLEKVLQIS